MKITFILPPVDLSGGIRVIANYAERLQWRAHDVRLVSVPAKKIPLKIKVKCLLRGRGWPKEKRLASHLDGMPVPHRVIETWRPIADRDVPDADVVVATWWETADWVNRLSPRKGAKVYFVQGDERVLCSHNPEEVQRVRATWHLPMQQITISRWLTNVLRKEAPGARIDLIPNSVNTQLFHAEARPKNQRPVIGFVYSDSWFRGTDIALRAIELARRELPDLKVVAFGHGPLPSPMNIEYQQSPPQEKIRNIYAQCDAWLFASRMEGFGLPILEAMACRTPVIAAPAGAAPELLDCGGGILVKPEDASDMAAAILKICRMPAERWKALSNSAMANATRYSWDNATDLFENSLRNACGRDNPAPEHTLTARR